MNVDLGLPHWAVVMLREQEGMRASLTVMAQGQRAIQGRLEDLMASVEELKAKQDAEAAVVAQVGSDLSAALARVAEDVAFLKSRVPTDVVPQERLDAIEQNIQALNGVSEQLKALDPVPENPAPAEPPTA